MFTRDRAGMAGARTQRPWSVYRESTLELSSEMISLALAGIINAVASFFYQFMS